MSALRSGGPIDMFNDHLPKDGSDGYAPCYSNQMSRTSATLWCVMCRRDGKLFAVDGERLHWQSLHGNNRPSLELGPLAVAMTVPDASLERELGSKKTPRKGSRRIGKTVGGGAKNGKKQRNL